MKVSFLYLHYSVRYDLLKDIFINMLQLENRKFSPAVFTVVTSVVQRLLQGKSFPLQKSMEVEIQNGSSV